MRPDDQWEELFLRIEELQDFLRRDRYTTLSELSSTVLSGDWDGAGILAKYAKAVEQAETLSFDMLALFRDFQTSPVVADLPPPPTQAEGLSGPPPLPLNDTPLPPPPPLTVYEALRKLLHSLKENETADDALYFMTPEKAVMYLAGFAYRLCRDNPVVGVRTVQAVESILEREHIHLTPNDWNHKVRVSGQEVSVAEANLRRARTLLSKIGVFDSGRHLWRVTREGMRAIEEWMADVQPHP